MTRSRMEARSRISPDIAAPQPTQSGMFARATARRMLTRPDPRLSKPSLEVDARDPAVAGVARELVRMMSATPGCIGLSAPQLGAMVRVVCVDVTGHPEARSCAGLIVLANPRVLHRAGNVVRVETCPSVPHVTGEVARAAAVVVEGILPGTTRLVRVTADAIEARTFLHELDHLDGYVFADRMLEASAELGARAYR